MGALLYKPNIHVLLKKKNKKLQHHGQATTATHSLDAKPQPHTMSQKSFYGLCHRNQTKEKLYELNFFAKKFIKRLPDGEISS